MSSLVSDRLLDVRLLEAGLGQLMSDAASALREASGDLVTVTLPVDDGTPANAGAWFTLNRVLTDAAYEFRASAPKATGLIQQMVRGMALAEEGEAPD